MHVFLASNGPFLITNSSEFKLIDSLIGAINSGQSIILDSPQISLARLSMSEEQSSRSRIAYSSELRALLVTAKKSSSSEFIYGAAHMTIPLTGWCYS